MDSYAVAEQPADDGDVQETKKSVERSLQLFFKAFGKAGAFKPLADSALPPGPAEQENVLAGCRLERAGYSFALPDNATGLVYLTICDSENQAVLSSIACTLRKPTPDQEKKLANITRTVLEETTARLAPEAKKKTPDTRQQAAADHTPQRQEAEPSARPEPAKQPKAAKAAPGALQAPSPPQTGGGKHASGLSAMPGAGILSMGMDPRALMRLAGLFTGMALLVQTVVSLLFYFFSSLCIYLIARKTDTRAAWLAWVPILQIFPLIESAQIAWWWGLVLYLAPIPLLWIPLLNMIVLLLWGLALVVFFALVWMRICERLDLNKWLGLVMFVPLFNVVLLALLAFHSESAGPAVPTRSIVGRAFLAFIVCAAVACGALYLYVLPFFQNALSQVQMQLIIRGQTRRMPAVSPQAGSKKTPGNAPGRASERSSRPGADQDVVLDKAYYEKLFQQKPPNFADDPFEKGRPQACTGPLCVLLSTFWEQQSPHVWLKVRIPEIPYLTLFNSGSMTITDVTDKNGANVYAADSSFETGRFTGLSFRRHTDGCLEAIRDVHLAPGVGEADIASVHGEVTLRLPLHVRSADFLPPDAGQSKTIAGLRMTLESLDGNNCKLRIAGDIDRFIGVRAFDAAGMVLDFGSSSSMSSENEKQAGYSFEGQIARITVYAAEKMLLKNYAVTLKKNSP